MSEIVQTEEADQISEPGQPKSRSRRELLAGAAGALGVIAVEAIAKMTPAEATNGDAVNVGSILTATSVTSITNSTDYDTAIYGAESGVQGNGIYGAASGYGGVGVVGACTGALGAAVYATAPSNATALQVQGRVKISHSGVVSIKAHKKSVVISAVPLYTSSYVLLTLQNNVAVTPHCAVLNVGASKFTIILDKPVPAGKTAKVAWAVMSYFG